MSTGQGGLGQRIWDQLELERAPYNIEDLKSEIARYDDSEPRQALRYSLLARYSLLVGDVCSARVFADRATLCDIPTTEGWFHYACFFEDKHLIGDRVVHGCSTIDEVVAGYSAIGGSFGFFCLGDFFEKIKSEKWAIKWHLDAVRADSDELYVERSKQRLSVLL